MFRATSQTDAKSILEVCLCSIFLATRFPLSSIVRRDAFSSGGPATAATSLSSSSFYLPFYGTSHSNGSSTFEKTRITNVVERVARTNNRWKRREAESGKDACYETIACENRRRRRGEQSPFDELSSCGRLCSILLLLLLVLLRRRHRRRRHRRRLLVLLFLLLPSLLPPPPPVPLCPASSSAVSSSVPSPPSLLPVFRIHLPTFPSLARLFPLRLFLPLLPRYSLLSFPSPTLLPTSGSPFPPRRLLRAKIKTRGR